MTCYSLFRNLPCSNNNLLTVEADSILVTLYTSGATRTILQMSFDRLEHTSGLLVKNKFYCVYGKMFFFTESFLEEHYESSKSTSHLLRVSITLG